MLKKFLVLQIKVWEVWLELFEFQKEYIYIDFDFDSDEVVYGGSDNEEK